MLDIFVVGFGRPDLLLEQVRLFNAHLLDDFQMCVIDNTPGDGAWQVEGACRTLKIGYQRNPISSLHNDALNYAAYIAINETGSSHWMVMDHDVFPRRDTTLVEKIDQAGFYGIGQRHAPTGHRYLWPGFCGFSREWLGHRVPNFDGIRGESKREDGDCGSMLWSLFSEDDWEKVYRPEHGYGSIRPEDGYGLQSYGYEFFDDFIHFTNASHWMEVPNPVGRDRLLLEMIKAL